VPRAFGLTDDQVRMFKQTIEASGLTLDEKVESVCYCPYHS